ncbi:hypothetical protein Sjap_021140 [Stephania japonica]|uniref:Uncharacterized protein n=1 Tax=Stephania japonica TaxID=461633 RepID=A0AAP0F386_9MAGN
MFTAMAFPCFKRKREQVCSDGRPLLSLSWVIELTSAVFAGKGNNIGPLENGCSQQGSFGD